MPEFRGRDLLTQEALIADASDCIILFAESVGSFCELGAFTALSSVRSKLTVVVDKKHADDKSFLMDGPVKMIGEQEAELGKAFFLDQACPTMNPKFVRFVSSIKGTVARLRDESKHINHDPNKIIVGSYVMELLDIVNLFTPVLAEDVEQVYKYIKGFNGSLRIVSPTITDSLAQSKGDKIRITTDQVLALMCSSQMIEAMEDSHGRTWFQPVIMPEHPFMFLNETHSDYQRARAGVLLRKRRMGIEVANDVYCRVD
jgi:hypothetical protein